MTPATHIILGKWYTYRENPHSKHTYMVKVLKENGKYMQRGELVQHYQIQMRQTKLNPYPFTVPKFTLFEYEPAKPKQNEMVFTWDGK